MNFRIGTIARLLGMSPEGVRLYEREGILRPRRGEGDGAYRTYQHLDLTALLRARGYRNLGFSSRETADLLNAATPGEVTAQYTLREESLEEEIRWKELLLQNLRETQALIAEAQNSLGAVRPGVRPAMYRFPFIRDGEFLLNREQERVFSQWARRTPLVFTTHSNDWEALRAGRTQATSALGILAGQAEELGLDLSFAELCPPCPCLRTITEERGEEYFQPLACLAPLLAYVEEHHIPAAGSPISRTFLSFNKRECYTRYREVWLPVAENTSFSE